MAVLDGAHVEAGFGEIEGWARELPAGSQVAIASRGEPSLPLGSLRAHGLVAELGAPELAMRPSEAAAMLSMAGVELGPADQEALLLRTEGWPAALYLAALAIRGGRDPHAVAVRFAGDDRLMADYLRDEILLRLRPSAVAFLLSTSVLERLSGPSCDALLGRSGSGGVLRDLSRGGVPLVPLDDADAEYRHHPLLAEMLRAEQRRRDPVRTADLHRRAGAWLERGGEIEDALGHALAAGDVADAGSRLWSIAGSRIAHGHVDSIGGWLDRCRPEQISSHAPLALAAACTHLADGDRDRLEHWLDTAERLIAAGEEIRHPPAAGARAVLRAFLARGGVSRMVDDAATAYELTAEHEPWRPLACMLHGAGLHLLGTPELAVPVLEEGARRGGVVAPIAQVLCLAQLALIRADDEDWEEAALVASRARAQLDREHIARYPSAALVYAVSALVRSHRDRIEAAQDDRRRAGALLARLVDPPPWYAVETRVALARTTLRLGDAAGARALLTEAGRMLPAMDDAPLAGRWVEECGAQADAFAASVFAGPASLTNAELRVLRAAADPPVLPRDGPLPPRHREHGEDPRARRLPQAGRVLALGGRGARPRHRPARRSRGQLWMKRVISPSIRSPLITPSTTSTATALMTSTLISTATAPPRAAAASTLRAVSVIGTHRGYPRSECGSCGLPAYPAHRPENRWLDAAGRNRKSADRRSRPAGSRLGSARCSVWQCTSRTSPGS